VSCRTRDCGRRPQRSAVLLRRLRFDLHSQIHPYQLAAKAEIAVRVRVLKLELAPLRHIGQAKVYDLRDELRVLDADARCGLGEIFRA